MSITRKLACLMMLSACVVLPAAAQIVRAEQFRGLAEMESNCAAMAGGRCEVVVSAPETITLSRSHTLPVGITVRFQDGGSWTVNGEALTFGSGVVVSSGVRRIFGGTAAIRGLKDARPEWFVPKAVTYPAEGLAAAYRATVPWGTVWLSEATYVSPFYDASKADSCGASAAPYRSPRRFVGVGRPHVDDESRPTQLVGGTIIQGEVCGWAPLQMTHLGVDVGPKVVQTLYGGRKSNGIFLPNHGSLNPKRGTHLADVSVLTNDMQGEHSVLIEGEENALIDGLWIWTPGGTHGLILKSAHSVVRDFHCKGAADDCLLVKSDYKTAANGLATDDQFEDITISYLAKAGDTGGIVLDARWDNVERISWKNVHEEGTSFGFRGAGSWFYELKDVKIENWNANELTGDCVAFAYSSELKMSDSTCNGKPATAVNSPQRDWGGEVKPHLRVLWTTLVTRVDLALHKN